MVLSSLCLGIIQEDFYPFGQHVGDSMLTSSDASFAHISLDQPYIIFGEQHTSVYVSTIIA